MNGRFTVSVGVQGLDWLTLTEAHPPKAEPPNLFWTSFMMILPPDHEVQVISRYVNKMSVKMTPSIAYRDRELGTVTKHHLKSVCQTNIKFSRQFVASTFSLQPITARCIDLIPLPHLYEALQVTRWHSERVDGAFQA